jgi:RNA 3'-terminal phosphate cyclase (ATP)
MLDKVKQGCSIGNEMNKEDTIVIDGSKGEGGGQIFRSSLTLAMCLGKAVCINNIRAGRSNPGLLRQHLTCLKAAKEICDASVEGESLGSKKVVFIPGKVKSGKYHFSVGTAGSSTLIFQTILMPLLFSAGKSEVILEGGTHNTMAPTFNFISKSFLPILKVMGCEVNVELKKYGFYPAGGGKWCAEISPASKLKKLALIDGGDLADISAHVISSKMPRHVTDRELNQIKKRCGIPDDSLHQQLVESAGPGNVVSLSVSEKGHEVIFEAFGEKNVSAERAANKAINAWYKFKDANVPICEHLADQLILPMILGSGGVYRTTKPTMHLLSNIDVVKSITGASIDVAQVDDLSWEITVTESALVKSLQYQSPIFKRV